MAYTAAMGTTYKFGADQNSGGTYGIYTGCQVVLNRFDHVLNKVEVTWRVSVWTNSDGSAASRVWTVNGSIFINGNSSASITTNQGATTYNNIYTGGANWQINRTDWLPCTGSGVISINKITCTVITQKNGTLSTTHQSNIYNTNNASLGTAPLNSPVNKGAWIYVNGGWHRCTVYIYNNGWYPAALETYDSGWKSTSRYTT